MNDILDNGIRSVGIRRNASFLMDLSDDGFTERFSELNAPTGEEPCAVAAVVGEKDSLRLI